MKKILLIDDDTYIRDAYNDYLTGEGFDVDTAINGEEGLRRLQIGGYDIVLLDVMMPGLDGLGVLDALQTTQPQLPNGPIILLTNLGHDPIMKKAEAKGVTRYLLKADLTPQDLANYIRKTIAQSTPLEKE